MDKHLRNKKITLRFTADEKEYLDKKKEMTIYEHYNDFILAAVTHCNIFTVDTKPMLAVAEQISKIGTNINQIAKAVNTSGNLYKNDVEDLRIKIKEIEKIIHDIIGISEKGRDGDFNNGIFENTLSEKRRTSGRGNKLHNEF